MNLGWNCHTSILIHGALAEAHTRFARLRTCLPEPIE
jgi:hypothetical protein